MLRARLYKPLGFLFLFIAFIGLLLPVLPTTPFLILSAWFFARSSEEWHKWLLSSELFGPMLRNWEENRCVSRRTKIVAILMMLIGGSVSILFALEHMYLRILTGILLMIGGATVLSLKTCPGDGDRTDP